MADPKDRTELSQRGPVIASVIVFAAIVALYLYTSTGPLARRAGQGRPPHVIAAEAGQAATQPAATQPAATTAPASRPATKPAVKWTPPVFEAGLRKRFAMVGTIRSYGLDDNETLAAMLAVPRHEFVPANLAYAAYDDTPLPIGYGQTISQPYMVAEMTRLLKLKADSKVLEVGTGSGYQAAVLTHFTPHVYTIEIIKPLAESAGARLKRLGYTVVKVRHGDGYYGWEEAQPFDAIIVTAVAGQVPPPLLKQLKRGGRMVIPVRGKYARQWLMLYEKRADGVTIGHQLMRVSFVPLTRKVR
jgi:protein-L-isoaspartate(D-aspartate) O-methyltransferase